MHEDETRFTKHRCAIKFALGRRDALLIFKTAILQSARYYYFDLRDLDDASELMAAIVCVIFSKKVYRDVTNEAVRPVQKRFVLDEAHRYISDPRSLSGNVP